MSDQAPASALLPAMGMWGDRVSTRARKAIIGYTLASTAFGIGRRAYHTARARVSFTVTVNGDDDIYSDIHRWLLDLVPDHRRRSVAARTVRSGSVSPVGSDASDGHSVAFLYDSTREQTVSIDGHRVTVAVIREQPGFAALMRDGELPPWLARKDRVEFVAYSRAGRDAVIALLNRIAAAKANSRPDFYVAQWGSFDRRSDIPYRQPDTVVLRSGQMERLVDDLTRFMAAEDRYAKLGVPWHRCLLLHGPPGSGKTSVAKALANHFGLDLFYIPLADLTEDSTLLRLVHQVRSRAMLLLEDIDVLHAATSREDDPGKVSMSGLLNALDGVGTPHGLITVMTTNHPARLDPALVRPGRVDLVEEVGYLDDDQLRRLFARFYGAAAAETAPTVDGQVSPAAAVEAILRNEQPADAAAALTVPHPTRGGSDGIRPTHHHG